MASCQFQSTSATTNYVTLTDGSDADVLHTHTGGNLTDDIFVLNAGDTMTGKLQIDVPTTTLEALVRSKPLKIKPVRLYGNSTYAWS